ncbi:hypothetical protein Y032_0044g927 [Ancylostoma ceylanicum]|uniref:Uncharacterized protein n=1 Tax=Ancylostoma ceylanicum TaxID=53326 RepID=A0A016UDT7_9BILA|nr:hypothetical protein Y032_0044g927 [Ancylostoma ceylanicum]
MAVVPNKCALARHQVKVQPNFKSKEDSLKNTKKTAAPKHYPHGKRKQKNNNDNAELMNSTVSSGKDKT